MYFRAIVLLICDQRFLGDRMIPQRLILKNFLSYRDTVLDFRGLHTACICGANGAGKSSLLEAIAWAVWGQSRAVTEDDIVHLGAQEAQVDFIFTHSHRTYRIVRTRYRGQATSLEFQLAQADPHEPAAALAAPLPQETSARTIPPTALSFRSLTAKGVRATQQLILEHIRLDYDTFINSAYLRQGRADEFMLKRPTERKQILSDLLKLTQYDELTERAKDRARQLKGQIDLLERTLTNIQEQLQQRELIQHERVELESVLVTMQAQQTADTEHLQVLQATQQQRQTWQQQLTWQHQQQRLLTQDCQRLSQELAVTQQQQYDLGALLQQEGAIATAYHRFQTIQAQEDILASKLQIYQAAQAQRLQYQQQQADKRSTLQNKLQQVQNQIDILQQQNDEIQQVLSKAPDIEAALEQLKQARDRLHRLDQLQAQVSPLLQRRQQLQSQVDRIHTHLATRLAELHHTAAQLQTQQERQPQLQRAVLEVGDRIETLEQRRLYQQQVRERGLERRHFMERLQADQRNYETQLAAVEQKIHLLKLESPEPSPNELAVNAPEKVSAPITLTTPPAPYPPCPLCDRPLDEHHWHLVLKKHTLERQDLLDQIWVIREQLSVAEREIQILRQEYRELEQELGQYSAVLERKGQLQEQLQITVGMQTALRQITAEVTAIGQSLQTEEYAADLQAELRLLDQSLQQLNYDEKNHALARGEVDRWRWAEIRQSDIKHAKHKQRQLAEQLTALDAQLLTLQHQLEQMTTETTHQLAELDQQIAAIGYDLDHHNDLRQCLRDSQPWQLRYQELCQARQQYPQVQQRTEQLVQSLQERQQALQTSQQQIDTLIQHLAHTPDCRPQMQTLEQQIQQRRSLLDSKLAHLGRLQQQEQQLETLSIQHHTLGTQLQTAQRQYRVYQELTQAFGKNGIPALMIENALPQLEAETNQILSRLSANQLHVQFVTQRSTRRDQVRQAKTKLANPKLIDTLDILIADARGTRPYETYSGGEAFRVNFAIRLALARLLALRSGTALQMLIVDEGFGTQDAEGCDRLVAAINAIAPDFACILTVTHVPHFKAAFQAHIEVTKTENGSQIALSL